MVVKYFKTWHFFCLDRRPPWGSNLHCTSINSCSSSSVHETTKQWPRGDGWTSWRLSWRPAHLYWPLQVKTGIQTHVLGIQKQSGCYTCLPRMQNKPLVKRNPCWSISVLCNQESYYKPTWNTLDLIPSGADAPWKRRYQYNPSCHSKILRTQLQCKMRNKTLVCSSVEMGNVTPGAFKNKGWTV